MPRTEQVPTERYYQGQRLRVYVAEVHDTQRGPQIIVSRAHRLMLRRLFEQEVPEIYTGAVEIKAIAREAGARSKVAVSARQEGIDPVGSCVGMRGVRIQNIVNELDGEKIDVVEWNEDAGALRRQRAQPGPGEPGEHRRGRQDGQGGRARAAALAGDRQRGPERAPGRQADRLAHRHQE